MPTTPVHAGTTRYPGGCLQPVLLRGRADYIDGGTGELLHRYTTVHELDGSRRIPLTALGEYVSRLLTERTAA